MVLILCYNIFMNKKQRKNKKTIQQNSIELSLKIYLNLNKNQKYTFKNLNSLSVDKILNTLEEIEHFFN